MKKFVLEYGRLLIAIIAILGFFTILGKLLSDKTNPNSIAGKFQKQYDGVSSIYDDSFYSSVIGDVVEKSTAPYFSIADNPEFEFTTAQVDWNRLFKDVSIRYKDKDITNSDTIDGKTIIKTVMVYEYTPSIIPSSDLDVNGHVEMEEVYAKDKYGHYIYQDANGYYSNSDYYNSATGHKVIITQPKFKISDGAEFDKNNYIDCEDKSSVNISKQYKVVYRVQIGKLKAECTVTYVKNKVGTNIDISGKSKIVFNYSEPQESAMP